MKIKLQFTLLASFISLIGLAQTTYYVDQTNGSNSNNGTSVATAYKTFDKAKNTVSAGDTISIVGEYTNPSYDASYTYSVPEQSHLWHRENTIRIAGLNGSSGNYITIKGFDNNTVIKGDGSNIIRVTNSSYLKFENLNIEGEVDRIPLSTANALQFVYVLGSNVTNPLASDIHYRNEEDSDGDHIVEETDTYPSLGNVTRPSYIDTRGLYVSGSDNIVIQNNTIHHTPGGGLRVSSSKFVDIISNEIYRCSARSYSGTHALVVTKTKPIGNNNYSVNILKNHVHHNYNEQYSWAPTKTIITPRIDEGKGISLQRNNLSSWINGQGRILVQNNLCYWNGFSGLHSNDGHRIDFINNTCYMNSYTNSVEPYGPAGSLSSEGQSGGNIGISTGGSGNDIKFINNISVVDTNWNGKALAATGSTNNLVVNDNLIFGINGTVSQDPDVTAVDVSTNIENPLFVDAPATYQNENYNFNFNIDATSPAIDASDNSVAPTDDFFGITRDATPDLGAIEYNASLSVINYDNSKFFIYPNPFSSVIHFDGIDTINTIKLYTITGQEIHLNKNTVINSKTINLSNLVNGIYILKINSTTVRKIIKK